MMQQVGYFLLLLLKVHIHIGIMRIQIDKIQQIYINVRAYMLDILAQQIVIVVQGYFVILEVHVNHYCLMVEHVLELLKFHQWLNKMVHVHQVIVIMTVLEQQMMVYVLQQQILIMIVKIINVNMMHILL